MILDLSIFDEETLDVKMVDGTIVHLKKPTQSLVIAMIRLRELSESTQPEEALAALNGITLKIMNNNADGIVFTPESVAELKLGVKNAILSAYSEFTLEFQKNPTYSSHRSPETPEETTARRSWFGLPGRSRNTRA